MSELRANTISDAAGTGPVTLTGQRAAKAWVNFNGTGTVAIRDSFNISSLTDVNTGRYSIAYSSSFSDADYAVLIGGRKNDSTDDANFAGACGNTTRVPASSSTPITTATSAGANRTDFPQVNVSSLGDLA